MKPVLISICVMICLLSLGCSRIFLAKEYQGQKITAQNSSIAIFYHGNPHIRYSGNVEKQLGKGPSGQVVAQYVKKQLVESIKEKALFSNVLFSEKSNVSTVDYFIERINGEPPEDILLPTNGTSFSANEETPDYALLLDNFILCNNRANDNYAPPSAKAYIMVHTGFVLWDNINHKTISYGIVDFSVADPEYCIFCDDAWGKFILQISDKIFVPSPFTSSVFPVPFFKLID